MVKYDNLAIALPRKCPYGNVGDTLWVREAFHKYQLKNNGIIYSYRAENKIIEDAMIWKPSIHMPKEAARIFLEITNIKVERLQDISEEDAIAEGIEPEPTGDFCFKNYLKSHNGNMKHKKRFSNYSYIPAYESFSSLWQSINGNDSWNENPFVWCITFEKTERIYENLS